MSDENDPQALIFRSRRNRPVAVPEEVVAQSDRTYQAYMLKRGGMDWADIAAELKYLNAAAAAYDVRTYLAEGKALLEDDQRRELLTMEVSRLDALQHAIWAQAMNGHLPAVNAARDLIMSRAKLLALTEPRDDDVAHGPRTVIVPMENGKFQDMLKQAAEETSGSA